MQPSKTYPGKNMPSYPLFKTTYSEGRIPSNDRPESYPKGMWLDIAAVQERVSAMQGNQKGHAAELATQINDIARGTKRGSLHVDARRLKKDLKLSLGGGGPMVISAGSNVNFRMTRR